MRDKKARRQSVVTRSVMLMLARPFKAGINGRSRTVRRVSDALKWLVAIGLHIHPSLRDGKSVMSGYPLALKGRANIETNLRVD